MNKLAGYCSVITPVLLVAWIVASTVWGLRISDNKGDIERYYQDTFQTLIQFSATWDRFMQVDEIEKELVQMELDSIRAVINSKADVFRGSYDRPFSTVEYKIK